MAGVAAADVRVDDRAADRRLDRDAGVVDASEGGAVVGARATVEGVAVARLAADHQVRAGAAVHRRRARVFFRVEDVDPVEDVVAAAPFERVGVVVFARVEDVVAGAADEPVGAGATFQGRGDRVRDALADRQFVVAGAEVGFDRVDAAAADDGAAAGAVGVGRVAVGDVGAADRVLAARVVDRALVGAGAAGQDQRRLAVDRLVDFDGQAIGACRRAAGGFFGEAAAALVGAGAAEGVVAGAARLEVVVAGAAVEPAVAGADQGVVAGATDRVLDSLPGARSRRRSRSGWQGRR